MFCKIFFLLMSGMTFRFFISDGLLQRIERLDIEKFHGLCWQSFILPFVHSFHECSKFLESKFEFSLYCISQPLTSLPPFFRVALFRSKFEKINLEDNTVALLQVFNSLKLYFTYFFSKFLCQWLLSISHGFISKNEAITE